jgi:hypothetical protein
MKIELVKESKVDRADWYSVHIDGKYVTGSYNLKDIENIYENLKTDPNYLETKKEILKSSEVDVSLEKIF